MQVVRKISLYVSYQTVNAPQEVVDGRFVEQEDKVKDVVDNQPGHVFGVAQVLTLNIQQLTWSRISNITQLLLCSKYEKAQNNGILVKKGEYCHKC